MDWIVFRVWGEIDRETGRDPDLPPPPTNLPCERASQKRSCHTRNPKHCPKPPGPNRPPSQRHRINNDNNRATINARTPQPRDRSSDNKYDRIGRRATYSRTDFEEDDGGDKDPFGGVVGIKLAEGELEGARGEHVGGAVPADVVEGVEIVGDAGDGGRDDGAVLEGVEFRKRFRWTEKEGRCTEGEERKLYQGYEEACQIHGCHDQGKDAGPGVRRRIFSASILTLRVPWPFTRKRVGWLVSTSSGFLHLRGNDVFRRVGSVRRRLRWDGFKRCERLAASSDIFL